MTSKQSVGAQSTMDFERPLVTVDIVVFAILDGKLNALLVQRKPDGNEPFPGQWALPGGFIHLTLDKNLHDCAMRKLKEKTGIEYAYLEQLGSWGDNQRDPRGWSVTQAYFSLIPDDLAATIQAGANSMDVRWVPVNSEQFLSKLAFDHTQIVSAALERLRNKVEYTSLPAFLVSKEFTLSELQKTYEIVLDRKLDKSAFRTRIMAAELVEEVPRFREGANRPAQLYTLKSAIDPIIFQRTFKSVSSEK